MGPSDVMETQPCTLRGSDPLLIKTDPVSDPLRIDMIDDIRFGFSRRIE